MTDREKLIELVREIVVPYFAEQIADHLLANGVAFVTDTNVGGKWIPVTERLPEDGELVWTWSESLRDLGMGVLDEFESTQVTHWMPLPQAPEDRENTMDIS